MTTKKFSLPRLAVFVPAIALGTGLMLAPIDSLSARARQTGVGKPPQSQTRPQGTPTRSPEARRSEEQRLPGPPVFAWWKDEEIKKHIGLSQERADQIEKWYQDRQQEMTPLITDYYAALKERDLLIAERKVTTQELVPKVVKLEALRSKLNESRTVMLYRFYRTLTAEQYQKLQDAFEKRSAARSGRGSGGPRY